MLMGETPPQTAEAAVIDSLRVDMEQEFVEGIKKLSQEQFIWPLVEVVSSMPKEELALVAEALINLTGLKRKASKDAETVGGPTDVAVISKGDGFVWIKRKHYFDAKLNPGFTAIRLQASEQGTEIGA